LLLISQLIEKKRPWKGKVTSRSHGRYGCWGNSGYLRMTVRGYGRDRKDWG
jgi:hypothetical protein